MPVSQIQDVSIGKLRPNPLNIRTHPKKQIHALARAINEFGFVVPTIVDASLVDALMSDLLDSEQAPLAVLPEGLGCGCCRDIALWL